MLITKNCDRWQPSKLWQSYFALLWFCFSAWLYLLVPNLQTVPNLNAGTVPGGKTVSTFGKTFLRQLSKSSLFKSDWHEIFPIASRAILLLYSCQLTYMRSPPYQFRNPTTFVLKRVVIPWSQIHLPNAHVSEESLTETFCDFLSWSTAPRRWKRGVSLFHFEYIQTRIWKQIQTRIWKQIQTQTQTKL